MSRQSLSVGWGNGPERGLKTGSFNLNFCNLKNSVDPDQTPISAAFDLGLHCLPICTVCQDVYISNRCENVMNEYFSSA